ncbi:hypothetical protein F4818DRAFT_78460 [Hypoxylon cercidicola]|nr:hypothetical protein F4818DRAFT_78460 [Hypoxylon cercidicola]
MQEVSGQMRNSKRRKFMRSRSGCFTCRRRKRKCDEAKPACGPCVRLGKKCEVYEQHFEFRNETPDLVKRTSTRDKEYPSLQEQELRIDAVPSTEGEGQQSPTTPGLVERKEKEPARKEGERLGSSECDTVVGIDYSQNSHDEYDIDGWGETASPIEPSLGNRVNGVRMWESEKYNGPVSMASSLKRLSNSTRPHALFGSHLSSNTPIEDGNFSRFRFTDASYIPRPFASFSLSEPCLSVEDIPFNQQEKYPVAGPSSGIGSPFAPDLPRDLGQASDIIGLEQEYLAHWNSNVCGLVPAALSEVTNAIETFLPIKSVVLALSACHLSQYEPTVKRPRLGEVAKTASMPNQRHQSICRMFYNKAIQQLSESETMGRVADTPMVLATMLFFSYIEWNSGSFKKFSMHLSGIQKLLTARIEHIGFTSLGNGLLRSWINLQAQHWWKLTPLTQWSLEKVAQAMGLGPSLTKILQAPESKRESILALLCETRRLNVLAYMEKYLGHDDRESLTLRAYRHIFHCLGRPVRYRPEQPIVPDIAGGYLDLLEKQGQKLEDWHASLPTKDLPMESFTAARMRSIFRATDTSITRTTTTTTTTTTKDAVTAISSETTTKSTTTVEEITGKGPVINIHPLQFSSHHSAMNYAYYATAQLMQDTGLLLEQTTPSAAEESNSQPSKVEINPWVVLLLRIAAAFDPGTCEHQNCFTIGLTELLIEAVQRCPVDAVLSYVYQWVERVHEAGVFQESGNLISLSLDYLRRIRNERAQGRYVWHSVGDTNADVEWCDTTAPSAYLDSVVLMGKDRHTGMLFSKLMVLE